jgi:multidrug efflux system membrane fusion protein
MSTREWDAASYDRLSDPQLAMARDVIDRLDLSGDERVLDAGCGSGRVTEVLLDRVPDGGVVAVDGSEAMVAQARARFEQRQVELKARLKLIEQGNMAALNRPQLEAELKAAEAALAQAEAERQKGWVLAPIAGVVNDVPVEVGQALQPGTTVAEVIALDPMLAVIEIAERQLGGVKIGERAEVRLVTGDKAKGTVRFVSRKASAQTRTYRVEINLDNPNGAIPDGVTCEVSLLLAPAPAAEVARSALTFSSEGKLGVRTVGEDGKVAFVPVAVVEDEQSFMWVTGLPDRSRVIVQGQDFVREGQTVDAVGVPELTAVAK